MRNFPGSYMCARRVVVAGLAVAWFAVLSVGTTHALPIVIDDFSAPAPQAAYAISIAHPDPTLIETPDPSLLSIMAGERDLLVDVDGISGPVSATGTIGGGTYMFGTVGMGASATLQYDGLDTSPGGDIHTPSAILVNSEGLGGADLTDSGTNVGIRLDFLFIDGGAGTVLGIEVEAHSTTGVATFSADIPHDPAPSSYLVPFAAFTDPAVLAGATSLEITLNPTAVHDVDFELDYIGVEIPEPHSLALLAGGMLPLVGRRRRIV